MSLLVMMNLLFIETIQFNYNLKGGHLSGRFLIKKLILFIKIGASKLIITIKIIKIKIE